MNRYYLKDIVTFIEGSYKILNPNDSYYIENLRSVMEAMDHDLCFIASNRKDKDYLINNSRGKIVFIDNSLLALAEKLRHRTFIIVDDPRVAFAAVANRIFKYSITYGIHPSAVIHPEAVIDPEVFIGPHTYVGKSTIGKGTVIFGNVHIYDNTFIGRNVRINAGVVIGAEGFGYLKNSSGELMNFPHIGGVKIEDDVEIGANSCIDRGGLGFTLIKRGAKIDNLVHIAHNVVVGVNTMVIANAMVGGSTVIGDNTWVAPSASLRDAITIGSNVTVGMGAVVTKNVPDNETFAGNPGRPLKEFAAVNQALKNLIKT